MIHRKLKREYARVIRELSDEVLRYVIEEGGHELKRRRLQTRERRAKKRRNIHETVPVQVVALDRN